MRELERFKNIESVSIKFKERFQYSFVSESGYTSGEVDTFHLTNTNIVINMGDQGMFAIFENPVTCTINKYRGKTELMCLKLG